MSNPAFAVGSLVSARGREWVVLPDSTDELLVVRPLGGSEEQKSGIWLPLEGNDVTTAALAPISLDDLGDHARTRLLRDALRLGFRSTAGPLRSFGRLGCTPRSYQLVPLLLALRLETVRLLIADDVGIGKTIEAGLILRELVDRGEVRRFTVLCSPHLAEQWQRELAEKLELQAELVLPSTVRRLERGLSIGESLFDHHPFTICSIDFVKAERRRGDFLRRCPELVIVDEAHTCSDPGENSGQRHQRHRLLAELAADPNRHLILLTATPHSGNEHAFRSLLALLDPSLTNLPTDLAGEQNRRAREQLARHLVQRRRHDITHWADEETPFPSRETSEVAWKLSAAYRTLFAKAVELAKETVAVAEGETAVRRRVRWWSALALLRSFASSPAAASATLRNRAATLDGTTLEEVDEIGARSLLDQVEDDESGFDAAAGATIDDSEDSAFKRRLRSLALEVDKLRPADDAKLEQATTIVRSLLEDGFSPILFCRFIPTAEAVAVELRRRFPDVEVAAVTGLLAPSERESRVLELGRAGRRILVATDCLSEGVNLQQFFDAVVHYDLSWNPTRHEQREGRVDRYGQPRSVVRTVTLYGHDTGIDGLVLEVLLRKHQAIRKSLGVSVPVPLDHEALAQAIFGGWLLREQGGGKVSDKQMALVFGDSEQPSQLEIEWEQSAERERKSRSMFAQHAVRPEEVKAELQEAERVAGGPETVRRLLEATFSHLGALVESGPNHLLANLTGQRRYLDVLGLDQPVLKGRYTPPAARGEVVLRRTAPLVGDLARMLVEDALEGAPEAIARRAGVLASAAVTRRTTLLLLRLRFQLLPARSEVPLLAEQALVVGFAGAPSADVAWLANEEVEALLDARPAANLARELKSSHLERVLEGLPGLGSRLDQLAHEHANMLASTHERIRHAAGRRGAAGRATVVTPLLPVDVIAVQILLPAGAASTGAPPT